MRVYVTPSQHGVGRRLSLEKIHDRLARLPVAPTLDLLAQIAYRADAAIVSSEAQRELAAQSLRPADARRFVDMSQRDPTLGVMASQMVVGLALHALVHCAGPHRNMGADDVPDLVELILALADHVGKAADDEELMLELIRLGLFYRLHDQDWWYELNHRLMHDVLPGLAHPQRVDVRQLIEDRSQISFDVFSALTSSIGVAVTQQPHFHRFPIALEGGVVDASDLLRWCDLWTIDLDSARERAAADIQHAASWSFGAFFDRPLLQVDDRLIAIRPQFVALKGTPMGLYDLVQRAIRDTGGDTQAWATFWGAAIEQLARDLLDETVPHLPRLRDEAEIRARWGAGKACDTVFLEDAWVAIDFVKRRLGAKTSTTGGLDALALDLQRGVLDKFIQIDHTLARGLDREGPPHEGFFPLVVVGAPFPTNGLVLNEIDRMLDAEGTLAIGLDGCHPPAVIDLAEFWLLLLTAKQQGRPVSTILRDWLHSPLGVAPFRDWLVTNGPGQPALGGDRRYWSHARRVLFGAA